MSASAPQTGPQSGVFGPLSQVFSFRSPLPERTQDGQSPVAKHMLIPVKHEDLSTACEQQSHSSERCSDIESTVAPILEPLPKPQEYRVGNEACHIWSTMEKKYYYSIGWFKSIKALASRSGRAS